MSMALNRILSWRDWFHDCPEWMLEAAVAGDLSIASVIPMIRPIFGLHERLERSPEEIADRLYAQVAPRFEHAMQRTVGGKTYERPDLPLCVLWQNVAWGTLAPNNPENEKLEAWSIQLLRLLAARVAELPQRPVAVLLDAEGYGTDQARRDRRDALLEEHFWQPLRAELGPDVTLGNYGSRPTASAPGQAVFYRGIRGACRGLENVVPPGTGGSAWIPMPGFWRRGGYGVVGAGDFAGLLWSACEPGGDVLLWGDNRSAGEWDTIERVLTLFGNRRGDRPWVDRRGYEGVVQVVGQDPGDPGPNPADRWFMP